MEEKKGLNVFPSNISVDFRCAVGPMVRDSGGIEGGAAIKWKIIIITAYEKKK